MKQLWAIIMIYFFSVLIIIILFHSNFKKTTQQTGEDGRKDVEIMVPLKYLANF